MFAYATFTKVHRRWLQAAFTVYLVALALVVFLPSQQAGTVTGFVGVIAGWLYYLGVPRSDGAVAVEFVSNIVMFVPFGALLRSLWPATWNWWRTLLLSAVTSTFIELTQFLIPGRVTAVSDVIANSSGGLIGAVVVAWLVNRCSP